jgi:transposase
MISSIRLDGSTACMTVEGATDAEIFRTYVQRVLCPTLRPGEVVIMDNLSPHKSALTLSLIEQAGAQVLFLPAYSPDLNPIPENVEQDQRNPAQHSSSNTARSPASHRFGF